MDNQTSKPKPLTNLPNSEPIQLIDSTVQLLRETIEKFNPIAVVGLFSGGHDSLTANLIAHEAGADTVLHINTGIGIEQTRDYVRQTCTDRGWKLAEYKATENTKKDGTPDPKIYEDMVRRWGFPGPFMHGQMYVFLKERQLERFERDIGATPSRPVIYLGGQRKDESIRRMRNMKQDVVKDGRRVWIAAIPNFSKSDCSRCIECFGAKRNQVVDLIHKSGECLCGAFAAPGEFAELKMWFPDVAKRIEDLETEVMQKWPWRWEDNGPPDWFKEKQQGQTFMFNYDQLGSQPLCHRCNLTALRDGERKIKEIS